MQRKGREEEGTVDNVECFGVFGADSMHVPVRPDDWTHSIRLIVAVKHDGAVIVSRQISLSKPTGTKMTRKRASHFRLEARLGRN